MTKEASQVRWVGDYSHSPGLRISTPATLNALFISLNQLGFPRRFHMNKRMHEQASDPRARFGLRGWVAKFIPTLPCRDICSQLLSHRSTQHLIQLFVILPSHDRPGFPTVKSCKEEAQKPIFQIAKKTSWQKSAANFQQRMT